MTGKTNTYMSTVMFACQSGCRKVSGSTARTCQADGRWAGTPLVCVKDCLKLDITNAIRTGSSYKYNSKLMFECETGTSYAGGEKERTCLADGTWTGSDIVCQMVKCPSLLAPARTKMTGTNNIYGSEISFKCQPGSRQYSGSVTRSCTEDGTWTGTLLLCVKDCAKLDITNAVRSGSVFIYNSKLSFSCASGTQYTSGDKRRTCQADGTWSGSHIVCQVTKCSTLTAPSGSRYTISQTSKSAVYTCKSGYTHACGADTKTCSNGKWVGIVDIECYNEIAMWNFDKYDSRVRLDPYGRSVFGVDGKVGTTIQLSGHRYSYAEVRRVDISRTSFTLSFLFKQTGKISQHLRTIFSDWRVSGRSRWQFLIRIWKDDKMSVSLRRNKYNSGSDPRQSMIELKTNTKFDVAYQWYAVSFIWDRQKKTGTFYVNGRYDSMVTSTRTDTDLQDSSYKQWYQIGYKGDSYNEWFQGHIAGMSIFGEVLSENCIRIIHKKIN
ncbi:CUB and sushi domain-containing protein 3-like [Lineus longissimus]|uniref:CUB and sushi domain-containing protein 3-like n=1 Tax=Lineus longissimus TaxID=88925 RepID=UPI00315D93D3